MSCIFLSLWSFYVIDWWREKIGDTFGHILNEFAWSTFSVDVKNFSTVVPNQFSTYTPMQSPKTSSDPLISLAETSTVGKFLFHADKNKFER